MEEVLCQAINNVDERYYKTKNPVFRNGERVKYSQSTVDLEEKFVREFYCQLRGLINGDDYILEGELQKIIVKDNDFGADNRLKEEVERYRIKRVKPDIVFHRGQEFNSKQDQVMALECKFGAIEKKAFNKDLVKLMLYDVSLNFQSCVFLIMKRTVEEVEGMISDFRENHFVITNPERISIIVKEDYGKAIKVLKLI